MKNIHIGSIIRQKLEESPLSIVDFASQINRTRTTVYDIFKRKSIDVDLLLSISEVLNYNFLEEVYLAKSCEQASTHLTSDCHYIIGMEVNEEQLKKFSDFEDQVIFKIEMKKKWTLIMPIDNKE